MYKNTTLEVNPSPVNARRLIMLSELKQIEIPSYIHEIAAMDADDYLQYKNASLARHLDDFKWRNVICRDRTNDDNSYTVDLIDCMVKQNKFPAIIVYISKTVENNWIESLTAAGISIAKSYDEPGDVFMMHANSLNSEFLKKYYSRVFPTRPKTFIIDFDYTPKTMNTWVINNCLEHSISNEFENFISIIGVNSKSFSYSIGIDLSFRRWFFAWIVTKTHNSKNCVRHISTVSSNFITWCKLFGVYYTNMDERRL